MSDKFSLHAQLDHDCFELMDFPLCKLLLCNDKAYPWFILVPRIRDIKEIYQLDWQQQQQLLNESSMLSEFLMQQYSGDKINVAALGNVCPQLHLHHIVRFKTDACWPKPVWGQQALTPYLDEDINELRHDLVSKLTLVLGDRSHD
jgi:diadenosine tetraphosphate (Ap4A) HIT family hydrolase